MTPKTQKLPNPPNEVVYLIQLQTYNPFHLSSPRVAENAEISFLRNHPKFSIDRRHNNNKKSMKGRTKKIKLNSENQPISISESIPKALIPTPSAYFYT